MARRDAQSPSSTARRGGVSSAASPYKRRSAAGVMARKGRAPERAAPLNAGYSAANG